MAEIIRIHGLDSKCVVLEVRELDQRGTVATLRKINPNITDTELQEYIQNENNCEFKTFTIALSPSNFSNRITIEDGIYNIFFKFGDKDMPLKMRRSVIEGYYGNEDSDVVMVRNLFEELSL